MPKEYGLKTARRGQRGHRHYATSEDKAAQRRAYGQYLQLAWEACGMAEYELNEQLAIAAGLCRDSFGNGGLPQAFRWHHHATGGHRMTSRAHATLLCRVAGLRKAARGSEVGGLGGGEEME